MGKTGNNIDSIIYKLTPNYSLGEVKFDTNVKQYLRSKKFEIISDKDLIKTTMYQLVYPNILISVDDRNIIDCVTCKYKCYILGINVIGLNIDYVKTQILKQDSDLEEYLWIFYKDKEVKQKVYDFDTLGIQVWTYRNKIVTVICSNLDDTTGPSGT